MAHPPDVTLKGIFRSNTPGLDHNTEYRLNDATIEVDLSEVEAVDQSMEGMPISIEGHSPELARGLRDTVVAHLYRLGGDPLNIPAPYVRASSRG